jgi:hypothetical protein
MSEETAVEQEVSDPVDTLPDQQMDFSSALDKAFEALNQPEPEPEPETEPESKSEETPEIQSEDKSEPEVEVEEKQEELESFDPTDNLDAEIGDDWTPKAASRFKQLKSELKSATDELEALRQKASESDVKVKELSGEINASDIEEMQKKLAEYEQEKMFTNLEDTEVYRTAISDPLDRLLENAREVADKYQISPDDLVDAMALQDTDAQDEKIAELMEDASDRDRARIYRVIEDINPILEKRADLIENASEALNEANLAKERDGELEMANRAKERQSAARNVVARVQKKLPFLSGFEGLDMSAVQEKAAAVDPSVIHPVDYTYNSVSAQILPSIVKEYASLRKENDVLTDRLAQYEDAEPSMSGSSPNSTPASSDASFADRIEAAFATKL